MDEVDVALEFCKTNLDKRKRNAKKLYKEITPFIETLYNAAKEYMENRNGEKLSRWILELPDPVGAKPGDSKMTQEARDADIVKTVLSEAVVDETFSYYTCLRLLIIHWAAYKLKILAATVKRI